MKLADLFIKLGLRKEGFDKGLNDAKNKTNAFGSAMKKIGGLAAGLFAVDRLVAFGKELFNIARQASGVENAFYRIASASDLANLRKSVKGTVSDLELMKRAVSASNFGIPVQELGTLLEFAAKRAQDTGQSVDYLVDSIVTGIGRKSPLILDNLGISAIQLTKELNGASVASASIGEVTAAVGRIADKSLNETGRLTDDLGTKAQSLGAKWDNLKLKFSNLLSNSDSLKKDLDDWGKLIEVWQADSLTTWQKFWASVRGSAMDEYYDQITQDQKDEQKRQEHFNKQSLEELQRQYDIYLNRRTDATIKGNAEEANFFNAQMSTIRKRIQEINKTKIQIPIEEQTTRIGALEQAAKDARAELEAFQKLPGKFAGEESAQAYIDKLTELEKKAKGSKRAFEIATMGVIQAPEIDSSVLDDAITKFNEEFQSAFDNSDDFKIKVAPEIDIEETKIMDQIQDMKDQFVKSFNDQIKSGIADITTSIASGIGEAIGAGDWSDFGKGVLQAIGGFMQQLGGLMIAYAINMALFAESAKNPLAWPVALAAGVALVAAGAAISSFASKGIGRPSASAYSGASGYSPSSSSATTALAGDVRFVLEGDKLVGAIGASNRKRAITG